MKATKATSSRLDYKQVDFPKETFVLTSNNEKNNIHIT